MEILYFGSLQEMVAGGQDGMIEFVTFIETLLNAPKELKDYLEGRTGFRMTFDSVLNHHLFKSERLKCSDILDFAEDFDEIYGGAEF
jgi:hypothetical protein